MITLTLAYKTYAQLPCGLSKQLRVIRLRWGRVELGIDPDTFDMIRSYPFRDAAIRRAFAIGIPKPLPV
jgi:hypothetical protein